MPVKGEPMPAERAPMRKIREVLRLKYACGLSERRIALAIGLSWPTIKAYLKGAESCGIAWPIAPEIRIPRSSGGCFHHSKIKSKSE